MLKWNKEKQEWEEIEMELKIKYVDRNNPEWEEF